MIIQMRYETVTVDCSRASAKERGSHPVTIGYDHHGIIKYVHAKCVDQKLVEATTRLGGQCCTQMRDTLKKHLTVKEQPDLASLFPYMTSLVWRRTSSIRRRRKENEESTATPVSVFARLASKAASKAAGFPLIAAIGKEDRGYRLYSPGNHNHLAVKNNEGQWVPSIDLLDITSQELRYAYRLPFEDSYKCDPCGKRFVSSRSADNHIYTSKHADKIAIGISRALTLLTRMHKNGLKWLVQS